MLSSDVDFVANEKTSKRKERERLESAPRLSIKMRSLSNINMTLLYFMGPKTRE